jgi:murein DD-endopeptidase MepM/ murein hydrolase activator NlpD
MKSQYFLRVVSLLVLLVSLVPVGSASALSQAAVTPPPADMFQLPWDLGIAWVAIDGIDNGTRRPLSSSHHWSVGGAIDFAPHNNMRKGEDTSNFWVAAAASGTVVAQSFCHVKIDHGNGWTTEYQFLGNVQVNVGDSVSRNQRLGVIADGVRLKFCLGSKEPDVPHLHFMLRPSLINAKLAGWEVNYLPVLNKTTFRKNNQTVGLFQPLLNTFDQVQIVLRGPITFDTLYTGSVDSFRYERWSLTLDQLTKFTLTATPTATGLVPLIVLMDSNANEIARSSGTLTSTQPAGNYFVQIQPQSGSGSYNLLLQKNDLPAGPFVSTTVSPASVSVGQTATAMVSLNNVPTEGYASAEFTCTYDSALAEVSNITVANLFGTDPAVAINNPQNGSFIVAVAGSSGNKATTDGTAFTFNITGKQAGQTTVECKARVSKGDNVLTSIDFIPGSLNVTGSAMTPTPGPSPTTPAESPTPSTPVASSTPTATQSTPGGTSTPTATQSTPVASSTSTQSTPGTSTPTATGPTPVESVTPTPSPTPFGPPPTTAPTSTSIPGDWLTYTNLKYGFQFRYPKEGQLLAGSTDNYARINLPFQPGTNLSEKYLEVIVAENANPCQSPLATESILETSENVTLNGIFFLKQTGGDGSAGHIHKWVAYSTGRDNACVSLDFVLSAANPGAFTTPPPLYNEALETAVYGQIASTYQWLDLSGTSTPTPVESTTPTATQSTPVGSPTATGLADGMLTGQVLASKAVTVSLYDGSNNLVTSVTANPDGSFSLSAPGGTYTIRASASGFLRAQGSATIPAGGTATKSALTLLAGDIDGNDVIDQFDALTIGMGYNATTPSEADLNSDGVINVLDLELLADNYRKSAPQAWD